MDEFALLEVLKSIWQHPVCQQVDAAMQPEPSDIYVETKS